MYLTHNFVSVQFYYCPITLCCTYLVMNQVHTYPKLHFLVPKIRLIKGLSRKAFFFKVLQEQLDIIQRRSVPDSSLVVSSLNPKCRFQIVWRLLSFFPWDNDCYARFLYQLKKKNRLGNIFFKMLLSHAVDFFKKHLRRDITNLHHLHFLRSKLCFIFWIGNYLEVIYLGKYNL